MVVLSDDDEGKYLVDATGEQFGIVSEVDEAAGVAYVDPDPGIVESISETFGHGDAESDDIRVPQESVANVTDDELQVDADL
ncbi:hypothetical protein [Halomicrobium salinisoli]|uniref:hypothetical protein n=1 Tax=Halomicrobium salinisoli TaxID=2878391 RepID=UPI001CF07C0B|nr:hypothetical protein [Halomicrobium salinisoli]